MPLQGDGVRTRSDNEQPQRSFDCLHKSTGLHKPRHDSTAQCVAVFEDGRHLTALPRLQVTAQIVQQMLGRSFNKNLNAAAAAKASSCVESDQLRLAAVEDITRTSD